MLAMSDGQQASPTRPALCPTKRQSAAFARRGQRAALCPTSVSLLPLARRASACCPLPDERQSVCPFPDERQSAAPCPTSVSPAVPDTRQPRLLPDGEATLPDAI